MSEDTVLRDMARRFFSENGESGLPTALVQWAECARLGWNVVGVPEEDGGVGGTLLDLATLIREAGRGASEVALIEDATARFCLAAGHLLASFADAELITLSTRRVLSQGGALTGTVEDVPWASQARFLVAATDEGWSLVDLHDHRVRVDPGVNIAGEPRGRVTLNACSPEVSWAASAATTPESLERRCALLRGCQLLGVLERTLELSVIHASSREQFGKTINKNQAIAHHLAIMRAGVDLATAEVKAALDAGIGDHAALAAMRSTLGVLSEDVSTRAHQIHAAIGVTSEHPLHRSTMRLWAYRDENGSQRYWTIRLGELVLDGGADSLWELTKPRSAVGGEA